MVSSCGVFLTFLFLTWSLLHFSYQLLCVLQPSSIVSSGGQVAKAIPLSIVSPQLRVRLVFQPSFLLNCIVCICEMYIAYCCVQMWACVCQDAHMEVRGQLWRIVYGCACCYIRVCLIYLFLLVCPCAACSRLTDLQDSGVFSCLCLLSHHMSAGTTDSHH